MKEVVFKIGNGKVVHFGRKHEDGLVESNCNNSFANDRNKDLKEYSELSEITCKSCHAQKEWYVRMDNIRKDEEEKSKTYNLREIGEVKVGEIYKEKATHFHFSGKYALNKAQVLGIETTVTNEEVVEIVIVALLNKDLTPATYKNHKGEDCEIVNKYESKYFIERFLDIQGNKLNA